MNVRLLILILVISGCTKEKRTFYKANLYNQTSHKVQIIPFANGNPVTAKIITLSPNSFFKIAQGSQHGISKTCGFSSDYLDNADSFHVLFDDVYRVSHYVYTPLQLSSRHHLYNSKRNIANCNSYEVIVDDPSRHSRNLTQNFYFTEPDYLFAR